MPLLFCLSLHIALVAANARLQEGESLFAFLDCIYATCAPNRVLAVHRIFAARGSDPLLHLCPPWQDADLEPRRTASSRCESLTTAARTIDPNAVVWRGDTQLAPHQQGIIVLGSPVGQEAFITAQLSAKREEHQSCWTGTRVCPMCRLHGCCLLFCGATRANCWIRTVSPRFSGGFARA